MRHLEPRTPWKVEAPTHKNVSHPALESGWFRIVEKDDSTVGYTPDEVTAKLFASAPALVEENKRLREALREALEDLVSYVEPCGICDGTGKRFKDDACVNCGGYGEVLQPSAIEAACSARAALERSKS